MEFEVVDEIIITDGRGGFKTGTNNPAYRPLEERIWEKVEGTREIQYKENGNLCWIWNGSCRETSRKDKYGRNYRTPQIWKEGKEVNVIRLMWELHNVPLTEDEFLCSSCHNLLCINPKHRYICSIHDIIENREVKRKETNKSHSKDALKKYELAGKIRTIHKQLMEEDVPPHKIVGEIRELVMSDVVSMSGITVIHNPETGKHKVNKSVDSFVRNIVKGKSYTDETWMNEYKEKHNIQ